jgi:hypothetical protein
MCDDTYYYRDRVRELEDINRFVKRNTLLSLQNRLEYIKNERDNSGLPVGGIDMSLEVVRSMLNEK